jgi:putative nucleotidyltransferase with HDIG domain
MQYFFGRDFVNSIGLALVASVMTPIFVLGFAIILGNLFDITTDLTLLELSDLNRPLLKQLSSRAPGTYHHSLMVGSLAESAAEMVQANPLLARVGAYYHDIGKMEYRDYFIENQYIFNPHDTIAPAESAQILNAHLSKGVKIAEEHHLPQVIKDIIAQHHGTNLMQYFYHKASRLSPTKVDLSIFRYPGPLPETKESGIIMLADMVEAAVRSIGQASPQEIENKVKEIIDQNYLNGQLEHCQLALADLHLIAQSFVGSLKAQAHHRITYPSWKELEGNEV